MRTLNTVSLYRPRTAFEALRDIAASARSIWGEYREERNHQRALGRRRRQAAKVFEMRCNGMRPTDLQEWHSPLFVGVFVFAWVVGTVEIFDLWPVIGHAARWVFAHLSFGSAR
jgi:hypothetical protein